MKVENFVSTKQNIMLISIAESNSPSNPSLFVGFEELLGRRAVYKQGI